MAFIFRNTYATDFADKRRTSAEFQVKKNLSLNSDTQVRKERYNTALATIAASQNSIRELEQQRQILQNQLSLARSSTPVDASRVNELEAQLANLDKRLSDERLSQQRREDQLQRLEVQLIESIIKDNEKFNGKNDNLNAGVVSARYLAAKQFDPNLSPIAFTEQTIATTPSTGRNALENRITKVASAAAKFRNIVEGRPDGQQSGLEARDPYAIFEPSVCGLIALDNEGNILADDKYNIPFQYIDGFKDSKSSNYTSTTPIGRFEPHRAYSGAEPYSITFELGYHAFETGPNSDEGFIQEIKDRWLASQYPIYGKNQQNGVRTYGTPNKYLLNVYSRYINIPVYIEGVSIEQEYALDPRTFFAMGFKMSVTLKTAYRLSQVISADDVITRGLRTYAHNFLS